MGRVCDSEAPTTVYGALLFWGHRLLCHPHAHLVLGKCPHFMSVTPEFQLAARVHGMRLPQWQPHPGAAFSNGGAGRVLTVGPPERTGLPFEGAQKSGRPVPSCVQRPAWGCTCEGLLQGAVVPGTKGVRGSLCPLPWSRGTVTTRPFPRPGQCNKKGRCCWERARLRCPIPQRL